MPRLFRQSPLNAIWEGSGNVIALDILRAMKTDRGAATALLAELRACRGADARLDSLTDELVSTLSTPMDDEAARHLESRARLLVDRMAIALQAATLIQHGHPAAAKAFCASRLPGGAARGGHPALSSIAQ